MRRGGLCRGAPPRSIDQLGMAARDRHCARAQVGSRITGRLAGWLPPPLKRMTAPGYREWIARVLARAALADLDDGGGGGAGARAVAQRMAATLGGQPPWLQALCEGLVRAPSWRTLDAPALADRILAAPGFGAAFAADAPPRVRRLILRSPRMQVPPLGLDGCALPALPTAGDLARWLELDIARLAWLANPALGWRTNLAATHQPAPHYRTQWRAKADGRLRLIEAPRPDLHAAQRRLLDGLLAAVPVHPACHGFVRGRSAASHAAAHVGRDIVVRLDLRDFFPSVRASRVHALWRTLGYPVGVAKLLTTLTTARTPAATLAAQRAAGRIDWLAAKKLASPHLPQGAPTSPALANLCAFRLDLRLDGLAWVFGATYTRYADDLVFSGAAPLRARLGALLAWTAGVAEDEGFQLHRGKTRVMPAHRAQRVGGITVNRHLNLPRPDFDRLRAVLHQCVRDGPAAQNRDAHPDFRAHLLGRIAWARQLNPARAARLAAVYDRIDWTT